MQREEKNGQSGLIILLILMILFGIYQVFISPLLNKEQEEVSSNEVEETEEERIARISEELYQTFSLSLEEESILTVEDQNYLNDKLSLYHMSNETRIYLGFKNLEEKYFTKDGGYSVKEALTNANGNYYYSGVYVMVDALNNSIKNIFGSIPIHHQTITLNNTKYVYNETKNLYEVWTVKKKQETSIEKITYKEVVNNENELYIYEYVAYTDYADVENLKTSTVHNSSIEVVITEDNVKDYLNYMDKYRYVFTRQEDGSYLFKDIEYIQE